MLKGKITLENLQRFRQSKPERFLKPVGFLIELSLRFISSNLRKKYYFQGSKTTFTQPSSRFLKIS
jgi:hypothetical protein